MEQTITTPTPGVLENRVLELTGLVGVVSSKIALVSETLRLFDENNLAFKVKVQRVDTLASMGDLLPCDPVESVILSTSVRCVLSHRHESLMRERVSLVSELSAINRQLSALGMSSSGDQ